MRMSVDLPAHWHCGRAERCDAHAEVAAAWAEAASAGAVVTRTPLSPAGPRPGLPLHWEKWQTAIQPFFHEIVDHPMQYFVRMNKS